MANYKIIVHGGAWDIPKQYHEDHKNGVEQAVLKGQQVLRSGGSAMDSCIAAVTCLEDDSTFDAGKGAFLNDEGKIELDAIVMDGTDLSIGSVAAVQNVKNPVQLANAIRLNSEHCVLVG